MRVEIWVPLVTTALVGCAGISPYPVSAVTPEAVVPEIARQFSACNLDALMANYSTTIEYVSPSTPEPILGRPALREHFSGACRGQVRAIMQVDAQRVRTLSPQSAVVTGTYSFGRTDRPNDKPWAAHFVITLRQVEGRWLVDTQATFPISRS